MAAGVKLEGFDLIIEQLQSAPAEVRTEAAGIVRDVTEGAASDLRAAYPTGPTGNLKRGVVTRYAAGDVLRGIVKSISPHSHLWHWGTKQRRNKKGANRGRMPAASPEPLVPIARRWRAEMQRRLIAMLERRGFKVSGEP